jgi:transposase
MPTHVIDRGKSDGIDAEATVRKVLAGDTMVVPKDTPGVVEPIRQLKVARDGALKARDAALVQLRDLIITAPAELREALSKRKTLRGRATTLCRRLRPHLTRLDEPLEAAIRSSNRRALGFHETRCALRALREIQTQLRFPTNTQRHRHLLERGLFRTSLHS